MSVSGIRKLISPFQKVLLNRKLCVGCTYPLDKAKILANIKPSMDLVECKCKRRYIKENDLNTFRRATLEEEYSFLKTKKEVK